MYVGRIYDDFPYHKASLSRREDKALVVYVPKYT